MSEMHRCKESQVKVVPVLDKKFTIYAKLLLLCAYLWQKTTCVEYWVTCIDELWRWLKRKRHF